MSSNKRTSVKSYLELIRQAQVLQPLLTTFVDRRSIDSVDAIVTAPLFYKVRIDGNVLRMEGYVIHLNNDKSNLTEIFPEQEFYTHRDLWVGSGADIFKDYNDYQQAERTIEKKFGTLYWTVSHQREAKFEEFYVDLNYRIIYVEISLSILESMLETAKEIEIRKDKTKPKTTIGLTISDTFLDKPPNDTHPTIS